MTAATNNKKRVWVKREPKVKIQPLPQYPPYVLELLAGRGIAGLDQIKDFLNPAYEKLTDPFVFKDMDKAVTRIWQAIESKQKIVIYSDYDADAITALSVMYLALQKLGANVDCYIPDRFAEGYGMNVEAIRKIKEEQNADAIITVDCGINSVDEALVCKQLGIDLIITDHHELTGTLPDAFAIINPKNPEDNYGYEYLTGVGVAFKVVQAVFEKGRRSKVEEIPVGWEKWFLDLVAVGTVADCQSLIGENRILVSFGLKVLAKSKWPGLRKLLELSQARQPYDSYTLGFLIAPRINAAGRIKHADSAFKLLVESDETVATGLAAELDSLNQQRQVLTQQILSEAREQIQSSGVRKINLVAGQDWPKGVVGLVAGKLTEEFNRPTLVIDKGSELATGSARSTDNFDMIQALGESKELLVKYGGHKQAAGFTLKSEDVQSLHAKLLEYADRVGFEPSEPRIYYDVELGEGQLSLDTLALVEQLGPFGVGNPKPKFVVRNLELVDFSAVGATKQHAKMRVRLQDTVYSAIAFNQAYLSNKLTEGGKFDALLELSKNEWNGFTRLDLKIVDIKI